MMFKVNWKFVIGFWLVVIILFSITECIAEGFYTEIGLGVHDPAIDGPEYTTTNPLGIVAVGWESSKWKIQLEHTSSLEGFPRVFDSPSEDGYGSNVLSVRYRLF